jgi:hypothetical protein
MGTTTALRAAIKRTFVPFLAQKGFAADTRYAPGTLTFRKVDSKAVCVCDIQWEKYGRPRFVVNFGKCSAKGVIFYGDRILPMDIFPENTPTPGRLQPGRSATTGGWFRQDRPMLARLFSKAKLHPPEKITAQLILLFGEVEEFWKSGRIGEHIHMSPIPEARRAKDAD